MVFKLWTLSSFVFIMNVSVRNRYCPFKSGLQRSNQRSFLPWLSSADSKTYAPIFYKSARFRTVRLKVPKKVEIFTIKQTWAFGKILHSSGLSFITMRKAQWLTKTLLWTFNFKCFDHLLFMVKKVKDVEHFSFVCKIFLNT